MESMQALERREAALCEAEEASRLRFQGLSSNFAEQKAELESNRRHAEERAVIAAGKVSSLQSELQGIRWGTCNLIIDISEFCALRAFAPELPGKVDVLARTRKQSELMVL